MGRRVRTRTVFTEGGIWGNCSPLEMLGYDQPRDSHFHERPCHGRTISERSLTDSHGQSGMLLTLSAVRSRRHSYHSQADSAGSIPVTRSTHEKRCRTMQSDAISLWIRHPLASEIGTRALPCPWPSLLDSLAPAAMDVSGSSSNRVSMRSIASAIARSRSAVRCWYMSAASMLACPIRPISSRVLAPVIELVTGNVPTMRIAA